MGKLLLTPVLIAIACLLAGTYGALHNQVSYTVSPEYFTQYKFHQFRIQTVPHRLGAAIVGWNAAWWMGIVIGIVLIPAGLGVPGRSNYFWTMIRAFGVVIGTTVAVGFLALAAAYLFLDAENVGEISRFGHAIENDVAFARAGTMHNCSYLGGLVGILSGGWAILKQRRKLNDIAS
jgi:hypothetical protein